MITIALGIEPILKSDLSESPFMSVNHAWCFIFLCASNRVRYVLWYIYSFTYNWLSHRDNLAYVANGIIYMWWVGCSASLCLAVTLNEETERHLSEKGIIDRRKSLRYTKYNRNIIVNNTLSSQTFAYDLFQKITYWVSITVAHDIINAIIIRHNRRILHMKFIDDDKTLNKSLYFIFF